MTKIIVVTGATQGIGLAISKWFMNQGHVVLACGRSKDKIEQLNKSVQNKSCFSVVDVSKKTDVEKWAEESIAKFGAPDLILNNAALAPEPQNLWETTLDVFDKTMDVNIKGVNYVIHYFLPAMLKAGKGVIINMSSGWGRSTAAKTAPYCCSKWAIEGLSSAVAHELPSPLACASLNPGMIHTEMLENYFGDQAQHNQNPEQWADHMGPLLLQLDRSCNGLQLSAP